MALMVVDQTLILHLTTLVLAVVVLVLAVVQGLARLLATAATECLTR